MKLMKSVRMVFLSALGFVLISEGIAQAPGEAPRAMPPGTWDYFGYVSWNALGKPPKYFDKPAEAIAKGNYASAYAQLKKLYVEHPNDPLIIQSIAECARQTRQLVPLLDLISVEALKETRAKGQLLRQTSPDRYLAYQYVLGTLSDVANSSKTQETFQPGSISRPAEFAYGSLYSRSFEEHLEEKRKCLLTISHLHARSLVRESREAARKSLAKFPNFYQLRIIYAETLVGGVTAVLGRDGNWKSPSPDLKSNPSEALRQAEIVIKQAPQFLPAYRMAGRAASLLDRNLAKRYLRHYVENSAPDAPGVRAAKEYLAKQ